MQKRKLDQFLDKFSLLNSQNSDEDILWSSNDSNDYETNTFPTKLNSTIKKQFKKRRRKKNVLKNISNLNISIVDVDKSGKILEKSPILKGKQSKNTHVNMSPVITQKSCYFPPYHISKSTSPIISSKPCSHQSIISKSPILKQKIKFDNTPKVRKKLFESKTVDTYVEEAERSTSPILTFSKDKYELNKSEYIKSCLENKTNNITTIYKEAKIIDDSSNRVGKNKKRMFMENFSSENSTQYTISDNTTPRNSQTKSSDDIELTKSMMEINNSTKIEKDNVSEDSTVYLNETTKKIRYKKDGLAYRFNALLKKHNANISLWQHERFLAENSNFIIPKKNYKPFRIQKVDIQYGCYLLKAMDQDDKHYTIVLPCSFVKTCHHLRENAMLKLYEPYKILEYSNFCRLIINVYKFESIITI